MKAIPTIIVVLICIWVLMLFGLAWHESKHPCLEYQDKPVHYDEYTTMEPATGIDLETGGPVMMLTPVHHPAQDAVEHVCVSRK